MNTLAKYITVGAIVALVGFLLWYFSSIVVYILISAVLSLMGKPIVDLITKIKIKNWHLPKSLGAAVALIIIWIFFYSFFRLMIPLVINQANELGTVDISHMINNFSQPIADFEAFVREYLPSSSNFSVKEFLSEKLSHVFNATMVSDFFSSTANILMNLFIAAFSISFITFFFLKEEKLFFDGLIMLFPEKYEVQIKHAIESVNHLLRRYFIGIIIQSICIMTLITIGLLIIGIKFDTAIVIGLLAGILNVIPYVGPLTGAIMAVLIGVATNLNLDFTTQIIPLIGYILLVFLATRIIDDVFFQPLIYSSSVNAHPLEIFIVILIAGSIAGILGMLLAIPTYTVLRVFAKEFFNKFRVVEKLTRKI
ncbi:MAG TPA: AI-2E family transporter [Bacteroidales bacterium]|nr:AI-2E family transporter [Bacteroidales bacterium]